MRIVKFLLLLFLGMGMAADLAGAMNVWAAGDHLRVNPLTGKALEDIPSLFPDGLMGNYRESSLVWDASRRRISLAAARNEIVSFQIIVERAGDQPLRDIQVKISDPVGPGGGKIPRENIDLFKEWYVNIKTPSRQSYTLGTGWYPDALLPCLRWTGNLYPHMYVLPFDIPDLLNNMGPRQKSHALWVDLYVPKERRDAPPGTYASTISVSSDAGEQELQLQLQVWDFMLPEESHLKANIHTDTEINALPETLELKYYQMIRRHRLAMGVLGYAPGLKVSGTDVQFDWKAYDARLSKYLDGSAFTEKFGYRGPGSGVPIELLVLPFDAYPINLYKQARGIGVGGKEFKYYRPWPLDLPREGPTPEYAEVWKKAFREFQDHFDRHPAWNKTRLVVYLLSLDEAYDDVARERMIYYGQLLKDSGARRLEYRVDGGYPKETMERLAKVLNIAILGLPSWNADAVSEIRAKGVDPWFYIGAGWIDGDPLQCRALSWLAWKLGAGSWTVWELDFNSLRAWQYPETYPNQNGHGMLIYRGETMGLDEPAASIRLKLMRRGSQDYEYFWLLSQSNGGRERLDGLLGAILHDVTGKLSSRLSLGAPGMWRHNGEEWEKVRIGIGSILDGHY
jgi:hypothetical protein